MNDLVPAGSAVAPVAAGVPVADAGGHVAYQSLADLPHDVDLASDDRAVVAEFSTAMAGAPREFVHRAIKWYAEYSQRQAASFETADEEDARDVRDVMQREWGSLFQANVRALRATFDALPAAVQMALETGTLNDGTLALHAPAVWRWLFDLARAPTGSRASASSIAQELAEIEALMGQRNSRYWKGKDAERLQARYRHLIDMQGGR